MRRFRFAFPVSVWVAVGSAVMAMLLAVSPALADTELGYTGKVGDRYLQDGVICDYDDSDYFVSITVPPPNMWARNTTAGVDSRKVGWRFFVMQYLDGAPGSTVFYKSRRWKATATDVTKAPFTAKTVSLSVPFSNTTQYTVVAKLFWYAKNGRTVIGTATRQYDLYKERNGTGMYDVGVCLGRFL